MSKTIKLGATGASLTGGTDATFVEVTTQAAGTKYVHDTADANGLRSHVRLLGREGNAAVGRKQKSTGVFTMPVTDSTSGEVRYVALRIELTADPRDIADTQLEMRMVGVQMLQNESLLWEVGSE